MTQYPRIDVTEWTFDEEEQAGRSEKEWLREPGADRVANSRWLFKPVIVHANGFTQGGDWAEKIAGEIARILGVPSAHIELAECRGRRGVLSKNVRPDGFELHSGHVWMDASPDVAYPGVGRTNRRRATVGYSLDHILGSLQLVGCPPDCPSDLREFGAEGVFGSYLLLDAIVANSDRHESNWAILRPIVGTGQVLLAPAYDNENSLGYQLTDDARAAIISGTKHGGVEGWVKRGRAVRFDCGGRFPIPSLVDLASEAVSRSGSSAYWDARLDLLTPELIEAIVARVPGMSDVERRFAISICTTNAERVRDAIRYL